MIRAIMDLALTQRIVVVGMAIALALIGAYAFSQLDIEAYPNPCPPLVVGGSDVRAAVANAIAMLKPGGRLGVVDFYVSPRRAAPGTVQHSAFARGFWPLWFAHDGVRLDAGHLPALRSLLPAHRLEERRSALPYLPGLRVPYYVFVGAKRS